MFKLLSMGKCFANSVDPAHCVLFIVLVQRLVKTGIVHKTSVSGLFRLHLDQDIKLNSPALFVSKMSLICITKSVPIYLIICVIRSNCYLFPVKFEFILGKCNTFFYFSCLLQ